MRWWPPSGSRTARFASATPRATKPKTGFTGTPPTRPPSCISRASASPESSSIRSNAVASPKSYARQTVLPERPQNSYCHAIGSVEYSYGHTIGGQRGRKGGRLAGDFGAHGAEDPRVHGPAPRLRHRAAH